MRTWKILRAHVKGITCACKFLREHVMLLFEHVKLLHEHVIVFMCAREVIMCAHEVIIFFFTMSLRGSVVYRNEWNERNERTHAIEISLYFSQVNAIEFGFWIFKRNIQPQHELKWTVNFRPSAILWGVLETRVADLTIIEKRPLTLLRGVYSSEIRFDSPQIPDEMFLLKLSKPDCHPVVVQTACLTVLQLPRKNPAECWSNLVGQ